MSADEKSLRRIPVAKCVVLRRNPQHLTKRQLDALSASIERDGFLVPILVRPIRAGRYEVVSGNHRFLAARQLQMTHVPAIVRAMDDRTAQRVAVNLNTIHGEPEIATLAPFLAEMDDATLRGTYLDDPLIDRLVAFDRDLAIAIARQDAPRALDRDSSRAPLPSCVCSSCGRRHAPAAS